MPQEPARIACESDAENERLPAGTLETELNPLLRGQREGAGRILLAQTATVLALGSGLCHALLHVK